MSGSSLVASHVGCLIGGFLIVTWWSSGQLKCQCPDCLVNLSCPAVTCTTGSIELSLTTVLGLGLLLSVLYISIWFFNQLGQVREPEVRNKSLALDGRRGSLGSAVSWRPGSG